MQLHNMVQVKLRNAVLLFDDSGVYEITNSTKVGLDIYIPPHEHYVCYLGTFEFNETEYLLVHGIESGGLSSEWITVYLFEIKYTHSGVEFMKADECVLYSQAHITTNHASMEIVSKGLNLNNESCLTYNTTNCRSEFSTSHEWLTHPNTHVESWKLCLDLDSSNNKLVVSSCYRIINDDSFDLAYLNVTNIQSISVQHPQSEYDE